MAASLHAVPSPRRGPATAAAGHPLPPSSSRSWRSAAACWAKSPAFGQRHRLPGRGGAARPRRPSLTCSTPNGRVASLQVSTTEAQESRRVGPGYAFEDGAARRMRRSLTSEDHLASIQRLRPGAFFESIRRSLWRNGPPKAPSRPHFGRLKPRLTSAGISSRASSTMTCSEGNVRVLGRRGARLGSGPGIGAFGGNAGGASMPRQEREKRAVGERPKLRLIRGKGMGTVDARKRPALTLVPR